MKEQPEVQRPEISPAVGRFIEVLDTAEILAQERYGTSIDGLRQQGEALGGDYTRIAEVVESASVAIGNDYQLWQETRSAGSHTMNFEDWRASRKQAFKQEYERLQGEVD